jgi:putative transposase
MARLRWTKSICWRRRDTFRSIRCGLVRRAGEWGWSSARAHLSGRNDELVVVKPLLDRCSVRFADLLESEASGEALSALRAAETIGRPLGSPTFLDALSAQVRRDPRPKKRGPRPRLGV